jgi:RNA polymerase sigma factor
MQTGQDNTIDLIKRLQQGDETARETLIANYQAFIVKLARNYTREKCDITGTDAYSTALLAFNEAAEKYNPEKGSQFYSFASQVINRRLIDMVRSNARYKPEINVENIPDRPSENDNRDLQEELAEDIKWFEETLKEFNISLEDLVRETPKHRDTRCKAIAMARHVINDPMLLARFERRKSLPFKNLLLKFRCNPKTIQRHRKYIIAVCIALNGSSLYLRDYILGVAKGCDDYGA